MMQAHIILATVLARYRFSFAGGPMPVPTMTMTVRPEGGVRLIATPV
jgi:cytochrome P450